MHTGNAGTKQNYRYTFADDQHQMQTYHFEGLPLAQMPNYHNSNPYLSPKQEERVIIEKNKKNGNVECQEEQRYAKIIEDISRILFHVFLN